MRCLENALHGGGGWVEAHTSTSAQLGSLVLLPLMPESKVSILSLNWCSIS